MGSLFLCLTSLNPYGDSQAILLGTPCCVLGLSHVIAMGLSLMTTLAHLSMVSLCATAHSHKPRGLKPPAKAFGYAQELLSQKFPVAPGPAMWLE